MMAYFIDLPGEIAAVDNGATIARRNQELYTNTKTST